MLLWIMSSNTNNKSHWLFWLTFAAMLAVFPAFAWQGYVAGFLTDDGTYLLMADFFSPYDGTQSAVEQFIMDQARFPPAFPVLIALFGGGSDNLHAAHLVNCATFLASGVVLYAWASRTLDSRNLGVACLAVYAVMPWTLVYVLEIWSEYLYLTVVLLALLLLDTTRHVASQRRLRELLWGCALLVGVAMLTRTIGVALFAAFVVHLYLHPARRKYGYIVVAAALPVIWQVIKMVNGYGGGYGEDLAKYLSAGGLQTLLLEDVPRNAALLLQSWGEHFAVTSDSPWPLHVLAFALLALTLVGAVERARDRCADFYYAALYTVIVLAWPYPEHLTRFIYPLMPLALVYIILGIHRIAPATGRLRRYASAAVVAALLAMVAPNIAYVVDRFFEPVPDYVREDYRHTRLWYRNTDLEDAIAKADQSAAVLRLLRRTKQHIGPRQCVYSAHPVSTMLHSDRISIIIPRNVSKGRLWGCPYLIAVNLHTAYEPNYPLRNVDPGRLELLDAERDSRGVQQAFLFKIKQQ